MANWLGVVCADHVQRGISLGIAQIGHGKRAGLAKMQAGDGIVYYSPRQAIDDEKPTLRAFTAIGTVADDHIWQADEGDFKPWRRKVSYTPDTTVTALSEVSSGLELTRDPHWGYSLRRGIVEISDHDYQVIRAAMMATK